MQQIINDGNAELLAYKQRQDNIKKHQQLKLFFQLSYPISGRKILFLRIGNTFCVPPLLNDKIS
jgi:hypothetical protein